MKAGLRVKMSEALKVELLAGGSSDHEAEFGACTGIVEGLVDYCEGADRPDEENRFGPEVDVRWQPSNLRYAYHPSKLDVVNLTIAVDGPAASGKGTLAKRIAEHYGLPFLDTGALYRATARDLLVSGAGPDQTEKAVNAANNIDPQTLNDPQLREPGVGEAASLVARIPEVRAALLDVQRRFCEQPSGAVLDGRDIGTVVCPKADVKLFIVADVSVRAQRRYLELVANGIETTEVQVLDDLIKRDERDSSRSSSPLVPAADAHLLDTTNLDIETSYRAAIELIEADLGSGGKTD